MHFHTWRILFPTRSPLVPARHSPGSGPERGFQSLSSALVRRASPTRKITVAPHVPITRTVPVNPHHKKSTFPPRRNPFSASSIASSATATPSSAWPQPSPA
jgi:hypothetical protein